MNVALLLAGGVGFGITSDIPKQYIRVNWKMMITYSIETLTASSQIDEIQIVAEHEWREYIIADCKEHGINTDKIRDFAIPGFNRQASILNGLQNIFREKNGLTDIDNVEENDNVLIHDASRPLVTIRQIDDCFEKMTDGYDGVIPVLFMEDAFCVGDNENNVLERIYGKISERQTPELFNLKKYYQANMELMPDKLKKIGNSVEPAIMAGMNLDVVLGDKSSFEVITQEDLDRFISILKFSS